MDAILLLLALIFLILLNAIVLPYPITDEGTMRYGSIPWVTCTLIVINVLVFTVWQYPFIRAMDAALSDGQYNAARQEFQAQVETYGAWGLAVREQEGIGALASFTGMFMHGDFLHLIGNMIYLWVFGRRVEDACGGLRYLLFYLFAGIVGNVASYIVLIGDDRPGIGASGAISGLIGAYAVLFPGTRIRCIWLSITGLRGAISALGRMLEIGSIPFRWTVSIPALLLLLPFIASNITNTIQAAQTGELVDNINYVAHGGGLVSGLLILLFARKDLVNRFMIGRRL